jgi:DAK2 domain fusion protein YloV
MRPVEGTILTVMSAAADGAAAALAAGGDLVTATSASREAAVETLARTPDMLPELAKAGVVDAGGAGLVLLFDAFLRVIDGRPLPEHLPIPASVAAVIADHAAGQIGPHGEVGETLEAGDAIDAVHEETGVGDLRYEVMYFLEAPDTAVNAFKRIWAGIGDSIVVVGGDGLWNCHIHTDDIGGSIEAALDVGRPREIRVTDLLEQVEEEQWVRTAASAQPALDTEPEEPAPVTSIVAVGTGAGIRRIFLSLGVRHVIAGGQSMNPSTEQILEIVEAVPSSEVVILPNNKNIYPVASQIGDLTEKHVRVVDTAGIQEGFAALLEYDPEAGADANAAAMAAAAARVVAGEVTRAVRASDSPVGKVEAGDWIGLSRAGIESVSQTASGAACALLERLVGEDHEIVTLIEGSGATAADTRRITEWLRACRPAVTIERHHGGQPLYPYLISIE